jgi:hypothetical protein
MESEGSAHQQTLSWVSWFQSTPSHPMHLNNYVNYVTLPPKLLWPSWFLILKCSDQNFGMHFSNFHACHIPCPPRPHGLITLIISNWYRFVKVNHMSQMNLLQSKWNDDKKMWELAVCRWPLAGSTPSFCGTSQSRTKRRKRGWNKSWVWDGRDAGRRGGWFWLKKKRERRK